MANYKYIKSLGIKAFAPIVASLYVSTAMPAIADEDIADLMEMSLQQLMEVEVTSVSKKVEKANETAAAIYVLTSDDIKNSGVTNIPEALRMVPGIQVARQSSNVWAVTSRGFAADLANKLLVLIDGRSVYNPLFSGVLWEEQGVPLENIERIEVIRGPGATLWGANAVNGVINIITKHSQDTQGGLASAGVGTFEKSTGLLRYGDKLSDESYYTAYMQHYDHGQTKDINKNEKNDDWDMQRAGFRVDTVLTEESSMQIQGDIYKGERDQPNDLLPSLTGTLDPVAGLVTQQQETHQMKGGNILAKYNRAFDDDSELDVQLYYDHAYRESDSIDYKIQTLDLEMQHFFDYNESNEVIWGLGYRFIHDNIDESQFAQFEDRDLEESMYLYSGFVQDKIQLSEDELYLTIGSKFEYNSYTGFEIQPNVRMAYYPAENQTIWGSVSRAVRTPSRSDRTLSQVALASPFLGPGFLTIDGNDDYQSEELIAYEVGYRFKPTTNSSLDLTAFYNDYQKIRTFETVAANTLRVDNKATAEVMGFEAAGNLQYSEKHTLTASYSFLDVDIERDIDSTDTIAVAQDQKSPKHMFNLRSNYKLSDEFSITNSAYYVDQLKGSNTDDYIRWDTQLTFLPAEDIEINLIGRNLLDDQHKEFDGATYNSVSEIPRAFYGKVTVRF